MALAVGKQQKNCNQSRNLMVLAVGKQQKNLTKRRVSQYGMPFLMEKFLKIY